MDDIMALFAKGSQCIKQFFEKLIKKIGDWFLDNKKGVESKLSKIKKALTKTRRVKFRTTKMLKKYVGEEKGIALLNFSKVKYLDDAERAAYQLAIVDGKLYTKNGKLFDTSFGGQNGNVTGNSIFVMDKEGRIFATNNYPVGEFHHSSFFAGAEVAAAGELKVTQGLIELVSKRSGHYRPTERYMKQFLKQMEESGIDVKNILVDF